MPRNQQMKRHKSIQLAAAAALAFAFAFAGCQEVEQPSPVLTQKQWSKVKKHILEPKKAPEPEYKIGANFDDKIELIGFSVGDPDKKEEAIKAGKRTTFRWYWKTLDDIEKNWKIFIHFDSKDTSVKPAKRRQNLDHQPLDGLFPTSKWPKGKVIEDVQHVRIRGDYPNGPAVPYIGFFRGKTRLPIKNDVPKTNDRRVKAPSLTVSSNAGGGKSKKSKKKGKPKYGIRTLDKKRGEAVNIDGRLDEDVWSDVKPIELSPFGSGPELETKIRVFRSDAHLYVGARMSDEHVWSEKKERDSNTWEEEVIEMFIDTDGDGQNYLELQINPLGTIFDANFKKRLGTGKGSRREQIDRAKKFTLEGLESEVHVEGTVNNKEKKDKFWSVELKIPTTSIPGVEKDPKPTKPWAVNFYRFDRPSKNRTLSYAWNTAPRGDFHQVSKFGVFRFALDPVELQKQINPKVLEQLQKGNKLDKPSMVPKAGKKAPTKPTVGKKPAKKDEKAEPAEKKEEEGSDKNEPAKKEEEQKAKPAKEEGGEK